MAKAAAGKGLQRPLTPSAPLAVVVGKKAIARGQVVKKLWDYIKENDLQNKREISLDENLEPIFGVPVKNPVSVSSGKMKEKEYLALVSKIKKQKKMTMFDMNKLLGNHLS